MVNRVRDSRFDFSARKAGHSFLGLQCQPASHLPENSNGVQETHGFGKMDEFAKKNNSERPLDTECHKVLRILIVNKLLTQNPQTFPFWNVCLIYPPFVLGGGVVVVAISNFIFPAANRNVS